MYKEESPDTWSQYLQTPRRGGSAMRLNRILKRRMQAFMKARQLKLSGNRRA